MNSHGFFGMNVVKSLVYNGRFSVGGFIRENVSRSKRNLLFKRKESTLDTESKSTSSLLLTRCHGRSVCLCRGTRPCMNTCLHCRSPWNYGFAAGSWLISCAVQRVANYKKCYVWWVGGRFWRLLLTQDSSSFESWIQRTASKLLNTSALCDLVDGTAGLIEACGRLFRTWINWIIVESFEYTSPFEEERLFYWRKPFVRGFKKFKKPSYCSYGPSVFILTISPSSCVKEMTIWFQQRKSFANSF